MIVTAIIIVDVTIIDVTIVDADCATIVICTMIDTGHDFSHKLREVINLLANRWSLRWV